jgi:hypothetical protein
VPPLLICASNGYPLIGQVPPQSGTPKLQFDGLNQSPVLPVQVLKQTQSASPRLLGEAESAKAVMASRIAFLVSVRGVCEVDFIFMRSEEVLFVEGF